MARLNDAVVPLSCRPPPSPPLCVCVMDDRLYLLLNDHQYPSTTFTSCTIDRSTNKNRKSAKGHGSCHRYNTCNVRAQPRLMQADPSTDDMADAVAAADSAPSSKMQLYTEVQLFQFIFYTFASASNRFKHNYVETRIGWRTKNKFNSWTHKKTQLKPINCSASKNNLESYELILWQ